MLPKVLRLASPETLTKTLPGQDNDAKQNAPASSFGIPRDGKSFGPLTME
jgi:hypothetical protein